MRIVTTFLGCRLKAWSIFIACVHTIFYGTFLAGLCFVFLAQFVCIPAGGRVSVISVEKINGTTETTLKLNSVPLSSVSLGQEGQRNLNCGYRASESPTFWTYAYFILGILGLAVFAGWGLLVFWSVLKKNQPFLASCINFKISMICFFLFSCLFDGFLGDSRGFTVGFMQIVVDCFIVYLLNGFYRTLQTEREDEEDEEEGGPATNQIDPEEDAPPPYSSVEFDTPPPPPFCEQFKV